MRKEKLLHPLDIDAYWLQRKLSKIYNDAMVSQEKSNEVLNVLKNAVDDRDCENQLVLLLGYDCFDFIKVLKKHRPMILYCTLLARSQSGSEKQKIRDQMKDDPILAKILRQLESEKEDDDGTEEVSFRNLRKKGDDDDENGAETVTGGQVSGTRRLIDIEDLAFSQGSHFMANKRCQLPDGSFRKNRKG